MNNEEYFHKFRKRCDSTYILQKIFGREITFLFMAYDSYANSVKITSTIQNKKKKKKLFFFIPLPMCMVKKLLFWSEILKNGNADRLIGLKVP